MKRFLFFFAAVAAVSLFTVSCEDSGDLEDYLPPVVVAGEDLTYYPEIVAVIPGYERIEVVWKLNEGDRTIGNTYIFWNAGEDAYEATISDNTYDEASGYYRQIIEVEEGTYTFFARNLDSDKYISAISPMFEATVYGAIAQSELRDRPMSSIAYDSDDFKYTINWGESETCVGSSVNYTMTTGQKADRVSSATDTSVELVTIAEDAEIKITSQHIPYRAVTATGYEDVLASMDMEGACLDTLSYIGASMEMQGDGSKLIYVTSIKELWEWMALWEDIDYDNASTEELQANLELKSNVYLKMAPGHYTISAEELSSGIDGVVHPILYLSVANTYVNSILLFSGDNCTFDFSGVEIELESILEMKDVAGKGIIRMVYVIGNSNTVKGLTFRCSGPEDVSSGDGASLVMCGQDNLFEDMTTYVQGCYPYGYGYVFGFGSGTTQISYKKHNGLLIGGDDNTARRCSIISRALGHVIYMQGSEKAVIEDCYTWAEWTTTDAILAEKGTGTAADLVNFVGWWDEQISPGYAVTQSEDAWRCYSSGTTYVRSPTTYKWISNIAGGIDSRHPDFSSGDVIVDEDSEEESTAASRSTKGSKTTGGSANNNRSGFRFYYGSSHYDAEDHVSRGCTFGFSTLSNTKIINCAADFSHGPVIQMESTLSNVVSDITIIPHDPADFYNYCTSDQTNGQGAAAYVRGSGHVLVFRDGSNQSQWGGYEGDLDYNLGVYMHLGGTHPADAKSDSNQSFKGSYVYNETKYPIRLCPNTGSTSNRNYIFLKKGTRVFVEDSEGNLVDSSTNDFKYATGISGNTIYNYFYEYTEAAANKAISSSSGTTSGHTRGSFVQVDGYSGYYFCPSGSTLTAADIAHDYYKDKQ